MASEVVSHISVSSLSRCWHLINIGWWGGLEGGEKWTAKKVKNEASSSQAFIDKNGHISSSSFSVCNLT